MEDRREQRDPVDKAWTRPTEVRIAVDCDDARPEVRHRARFSLGPARVPATRHDDDDLGPRGADLVPVELARARAGFSKHVVSTRQIDLFRHPVPPVERRVDPFDAGHARSCPAGDRVSYCVHPRTQRSHELSRRGRATEGITDPHDICVHAFERRRFERYDAWPVRQVARYLIEGHCADGAEGLPKDHIRRGFAKRAGVEVERAVTT